MQPKNHCKIWRKFTLKYDISTAQVRRYGCLIQYASESFLIHDYVWRILFSFLPYPQHLTDEGILGDIKYSILDIIFPFWNGKILKNLGISAETIFIYHLFRGGETISALVPTAMFSINLILVYKTRYLGILSKK